MGTLHYSGGLADLSSSKQQALLRLHILQSIPNNTFLFTVWMGTSLQMIPQIVLPGYRELHSDTVI